MEGSGLALAVPPELVELVKERVLDELAGRGDVHVGDPYIDAAAAAEYIGAPNRQRIYDLVQQRALTPSGHDGRKPLFRRSDLDRYVAGRG